jgi:hypothetical protein
MQRTFKLTGKTPADGAQVIDMAGYGRVKAKQVQLTSKSSSAGSMAVAIRTPGTEEYMTVETVNMVAGTLVFPVDFYCDAMRFTPTSTDAAKDFDISVFCLQG